MPVLVPSGPLFVPSAQQQPVRYSFELGPWNSLPVTDLTVLTGRSVTWRRQGNHEASFTLDGSRPEAALINEVDSDLWISLDNHTYFRGAVGTSNDSGDPDSESCQFTATDYRFELSNRQLVEGDQLVFTGDQAQLAWQLIANNQAKPGRNLRIAQGSNYTTGIVPSPSPTFAVGTDLRSCIDQYALSDTGFDWDITPITGSTRQTFDVWYPQRGTDRREVLDFPGRIQSFTRSFDGSLYKQALSGTGADGVPAVNIDAPDIATSGHRVREGQFSDTDIQTLSALQGRTRAELSKKLFASWTVTLAPDMWFGPQQIWLGDPVILAVTEGRHAGTVESLIVEEINVQLDDNTDAATAQITLGAPAANLKWRLRNFENSIAKLSKR